MGMVPSPGQIKDGTQVHMSMTKRTDLENSTGLMARCTKGNGKMAGSMALDFSLLQDIVLLLKKVNGSMDVELVGYKNKNANYYNIKYVLTLFNENSEV